MDGFGLYANTLRLKFSAKSLLRKVQCTVEGIIKHCDGRCCKGDAFWPSKASAKHDSTGLRICHYLEATGCSLPQDEKPITCRLYPLVINSNNTVIVHFRAPSFCKGNIGEGEPLIDSMRECLVSIFGQQTYDIIRNGVQHGVDVYVDVPNEIREQLAKEAGQEKNMVIP